MSAVNFVTPGWFSTFGTRVIAGRDVTDRDRAGAPRVALANQAFARKFLNGASPLGHTIASTVGMPARAAVDRDRRRRRGRGVRIAARAGASDAVPADGAGRLASAEHPGADGSERAKSSGTPPALLARSVAAAIREREPESGGDVAIAHRPGQRDADPGAGRRDAVRLLRRARASACGARALRRDVVRRQPPAHRDRNPHGARRRASRRGPPRSLARDGARRRSASWSARASACGRRSSWRRCSMDSNRAIR